MATISDDATGYRLEPWFEGKTRARIRWVAQDGEHDDLAVTEHAALDLLAFIHAEPEAGLISCELAHDNSPEH